MTEQSEVEYEVSAEPEHDDVAGVDVNEYVTTTTYGLFNDPRIWESRFVAAGGDIPDAMREIILETPIYTDEDGQRIINHARLTNEHRRDTGTLDRDGMVVIKRQIRIESPWVLDVDSEEELRPIRDVRINLESVRPI